MNRNRKSRRAALPTALLAMLLPALASGQQQRALEFPAAPGLPGLQDLGAIMQMHMTTGSSRSISMTVENGVKKINAQEDGLKAFIEEHPDGLVIVKITRQYTADDLDELMDIEPELYMHLKSIPDKTDTAEVEVSVGVTRKYEADSLEELEKDHPDAFKVYEQFTSGSNADLDRLRDFPGITLPAIRMPMPRGMQLDIQPDDIRIFPQTEDDDAPDVSDEDKDA